MLSRLAAMGLLFLRATSSLAWMPAAARLPRSTGSTVARSLHVCRRQWPTAVGPTNANGLSCVSPASSGDAGAVTTPAATASGEDGEERQGGREAGGEKGGRAVGGGADIQPLLRKHMEVLETRGRRTVKARQHVNPLAATFQEPVVLPEGWFGSAFRNPSAPLLVDIGCAKGTFVTGMAKAKPDRNFLGLEIRRPVAAVGLSRAAELETRNCHLVCCNANVDLDTVLTEAARNGASIDTICIQFPDPHFKTKHYKRRVMQPELVTCIEKHLRPGGTLFMQSDVLEVLEDMRSITRETAEVLEDSRPDMEDWMEGSDNNPFEALDGGWPLSKKEADILAKKTEVVIRAHAAA